MSNESDRRTSVLGVSTYIQGQPCKYWNTRAAGDQQIPSARSLLVALADDSNGLAKELWSSSLSMWFRPAEF